MQRLFKTGARVLANHRSILTSPKEDLFAHVISIRTSHTREFSSSEQSNKSSLSQANLNKLLYRARQRGWLELDLIIGLWAEKHLATLPHNILTDFEALLIEENPDLFKWITKQLPAPELVKKNKAFQMIQKEVEGALDTYGSLSAKAGDGAEWVRGWDDDKRNPPGTVPK